MNPSLSDGVYSHWYISITDSSNSLRSPSQTSQKIVLLAAIQVDMQNYELYLFYVDSGFLPCGF